MKSIKWKKWRLSKFRYPTYEVKGDRSHNRPGANVVGRVAAAASLAERLGRVRVDAMKTADTRAPKWIFMEPIKAAAK